MFTSNFFKWLNFCQTVQMGSTLDERSYPAGLVNTSGNTFNVWNGGNSASYFWNASVDRTMSYLSIGCDNHTGDYAINTYELSDKLNNITITNTNLIQGLDDNNNLESVIGFSLTASSDTTVKHIGIYKGFIVPFNSSVDTYSLFAIVPVDIELPANTTKNYTINLLTYNMEEV